MTSDDFASVVPTDIMQRYPVLSHDASDLDKLVCLGVTSRSTPAWINEDFVSADLRLVVGNIEPHQFMGFSGGFKSAAIGLAGSQTITHNHTMMTDARATLGHFEDNPTRQDVEEIGRLIGVHLALNAIVNQDREIVEVLAGEPHEVMQRGIPLVREVCQVQASGPLDLVLASPGGHPKDINLYQSQKALAHASLVTKDGGTIILVAACRDGTGSPSYERWMQGVASFDEVFSRFEQEGFRLGPHKALQIARDAARVRVLMVSQMPPDLVRQLLLTPVDSLGAALSLALDAHLPQGELRVGVMPWANATIPIVE
jgi:nickel-dependent lactate racemase